MGGFRSAVNSGFCFVSHIAFASVSGQSSEKIRRDTSWTYFCSVKHLSAGITLVSLQFVIIYRSQHFSLVLSQILSTVATHTAAPAMNGEVYCREALPGISRYIRFYTAFSFSSLPVADGVDF